MFWDNSKAHIGSLQCKSPICVSFGKFLQCVHHKHERWSQWILLELLKKTLLTFVRINKSPGNRFCSAMNKSDSMTFCVIFTQNWMNNFIFGTNTVALICGHYLKLSSLQVERVFTLFVSLLVCVCFFYFYFVVVGPVWHFCYSVIIPLAVILTPIYASRDDNRFNKKMEK